MGLAVPRRLRAAQDARPAGGADRAAVDRAHLRGGGAADPRAPRQRRGGGRRHVLGPVGRVARGAAPGHARGRAQARVGAERGHGGAAGRGHARGRAAPVGRQLRRGQRRGGAGPVPVPLARGLRARGRLDGADGLAAAQQEPLPHLHGAGHGRHLGRDHAHRLGHVQQHPHPRPRAPGVGAAGAEGEVQERPTA